MQWSGEALVSFLVCQNSSVGRASDILSEGPWFESKFWLMIQANP